jgi:hypothetical protein
MNKFETSNCFGGTLVQLQKSESVEWRELDRKEGTNSCNILLSGCYLLLPPWIKSQPGLSGGTTTCNLG